MYTGLGPVWGITTRRGGGAGVTGGVVAEAPSGDAEVSDAAGGGVAGTGIGGGVGVNSAGAGVGGPGEAGIGVAAAIAAALRASASGEPGAGGFTATGPAGGLAAIAGCTAEGGAATMRGSCRGWGTILRGTRTACAGFTGELPVDGDVAAGAFASAVNDDFCAGGATCGATAFAAVSTAEVGGGATTTALARAAAADRARASAAAAASCFPC